MIDAEELKKRVDIVAVIGSYTELKKRGSEFVGKCPIHGGDGNNFYVNPQKRIWSCFSLGCHEGDEGNDVIGFIRKMHGDGYVEACERLNGATTWPTRAITQEANPLPDRLTSKPPRGAGTPNMTLRELGDPSAVWTYRDGQNDVLGYVARYETADGKQIRAWTYGARGDLQPAWGCGQWTRPNRPLYGLDRLAANPARAVLVCEGEKAADAADALLGASYAAVTWPGGAQAWKHAEWGYLKGRRVLLWPDADEPGVKAMQGLASLIADPKGLACTVRIVEPPPDQVAGWDLGDALAGGYSTVDVIAYAKAHVRTYVHVAEQHEEKPEQPECRDSDTSTDPAPPPTPSSVERAPIHAPADGAGPDNAPVDAQAGSGATQAPEAHEHGQAPENRSEARKPVKTRKNRPSLAVVDGGAARKPDPEHETLPVSLSEDHLAEVFAGERGEDWRYVARWARWLKWDGSGWVEDEVSEAFAVARDICRRATKWPEAASLNYSQKQKISRKATAGNVRDMAGTDRRIRASVDQWDTNPWLLGVPGGVVDLQTGKELEGAREHYITKRAAVRPADGQTPLWDSVIARSTRGDATMAHYLQKWAGYMLTGDTREEAFLFVHGPGGSGKSTFVQVLRDCMGSYAKAARIEAFMATRGQEHPTEIADLAGARLVSAPETEESSRWNESRIKMLTGRDKVKARFMGRDYFEFDPVCKIMIYGNHRPRLHSVGEEMKRRIHLVEFQDAIPVEERNQGLKDAIRAEYPAVLAWMIAGSLHWQQEGLGRPEQVSEATNEYLSSQDTLGAWLDECCDRGADARCQVSNAYRSFEAWARVRGEFVPSVTVFSEKMQTRGIAKKKISVMYFLGISLKDSGQPPPSYDRD